MAAQSNIKSPENFSFKPPEWPEWKQRFARYRLITKLNKEDGEIQVNSLIYHMGAEAEKMLMRFKFDAEADANDYEKVLKKFDEHFVPRNNVVHERARFRRRVQKAGETVEAYVRDLYHIVNKCEYGDRDEHIRDQLIFGIQDKELSRKLQCKPNITVEKAVDMAMYSETVTHQVAAQLRKSPGFR
ncbi:uncharacterized protein [Ptychodera flava]|uniref:uncharacterized protein n=1 Tax=Ptychodera flava TaxID=63121 RepID=UPI00396A46C5